MGLTKADEVRQGQGRLHRAGRPRRARRASPHRRCSYIEHRQLQKLRGTYLDALPQLADAEGRIHTTFNQVGTATGRLSSTNPNLQNIPIRTAIGRDIRAAFIAARDLTATCSCRPTTARSSCASWRTSRRTPCCSTPTAPTRTSTPSPRPRSSASPSPHLDKETRARAKAVNFGIVYGISPFGLAAQLGIDQKIAKTYIETYFDRYKGVRRFIDATLDDRKESDQAVRTHFGRIRPIPDIGSRNPNMRGFAERTAVNTPLQGTAADLIKLAMIALDREIAAPQPPLPHDVTSARRAALRRRPRRSR